MTWLPAALIALAVLLASLRFCQPPRPPAMRLSALLALQAIAAALLWLALSPPPQPMPAATLVIATADATAAELSALPAATRLRLPEAPALADAAPVPDLATALRRHPGTRELVIVGQGLPARDRGVALPALRFQPAAAPRGLVELQAPPVLAPGARFAVGTRVQGLPQARVELLDPAGHRVALATPGDDGRVRLGASARDAGDVAFTLRALDADGKVLDRLPVPVRVQAVPSPALRLLAGAPGPELKYLQRWAADTGARLQTGISLGGGVQLGDAPPALDAASLAKLDLLLLDERRLSALSSAQRTAIAAAMRDGLGVLLRMTGPLDGNARRALREWGLETRGGERSATVQLRDAAPAVEDGATPTAPSVERFDLAFAGNDVAPLLHAANGSAIGGWRAIGQGRLGVLPIADSYTMVLAGHTDAHAELWNAVLSTVARPLPVSPLRQLPAWAWAGERSALCGLPTGSEAIAPDGTRSTLLPDPHANQCSGWWPQAAGWHRIVAGDDSAGVLVIDPADARALHAQATRDATLALHASGDAGHRATRPLPGPRWPWLLAFVLMASLLWWLERRPMPSGIPHALGKA
ncbi:carboxypeptidase regulatory-like domain-containing protein [Stenotrophomonas sp. NLF4-10]|uniref:carboxypeptidase regulatory-like domain-containing protein n=1 Tax=Stenotrophomonas sp. NLF4-10 TaxID=2918754 RepID=UPI001EFB48C0|nr:carboxypeptidase regulatory-like domain-containing protein [Stenotrophomonas sp. NLF4-10]MCG8275118.1 carboxypeptidase regulatory-like domain-containing protein [Stenotrophomonas sp. NLF4-10]